MADTAYVAPAAFVAAVGVVFAAVVTALARSYLANVETRRHLWEYRMKRRAERQETYQAAIDLLTDWGWRSFDPKFDIVSEFTIPFVRVANRVRVYGSPASVAAVDEIQRGFAMLNKSEKEVDSQAAHEAIHIGHSHLVMAAREDVGPRKDDGFRDVPFQPGAGPLA